MAAFWLGRGRGLAARGREGPRLEVAPQPVRARRGRPADRGRVNPKTGSVFRSIPGERHADVVNVKGDTHSRPLSLTIWPHSAATAFEPWPNLLQPEQMRKWRRFCAEALR